MRFITKRTVFVAIISSLMLSAIGFGQTKQGDGTPLQRLEVMREKLDRMRRSLSSVAAAIKEENKDDKSKKDDKDKPGTPLGRLVNLEKRQQDCKVTSITFAEKVDRGEKYERADLDTLEQVVAEFQARVDTANLKPHPPERFLTVRLARRDVKKKKNFSAFLAVAVMTSMTN
ncbi:MAG: hypothetical protein IPK98_03690 [Chloracidobacterium sp.]|nr:hypothetical protein [Chloracidobacterium sp.]